MKIEEALKSDSFKKCKKITRGHGVVYQTGSRLTGMQNRNSDYDFYVFYVPTKYELLTRDNEKGEVLKFKDGEAKVFMIEHLFSLLQKANPNIVELFFQKPLYVSDDCKELTDYLYENREKLPLFNKLKFISSCAGMLKGNLNRLKPDKVFYGEGSFGKELYNYIKAYRYGYAVLQGHSLEKEIFLQGKNLKELKNIKSVERWDDCLYHQIVVTNYSKSKYFDELSKYQSDIEHDEYQENLLDKESYNLELAVTQLLPLYFK